MDIGRECSGSAAAEEGAIKNNSINNLPAAQACAACKFQRRRCSADCPLAPYFPANRVQDFQNVRKLFGVKNVLKTLSHLDHSKRFMAVECMIFEANCRAGDLAGGCYRIIASLQREITLLEAQRQRIFVQLRICRQTAAAGSHGGAVCSDFVDFDGKPGLSSLLLDFSQSENFEDRILKEICNLN